MRKWHPERAAGSPCKYQRLPIDPALLAAIEHIIAPAFVVASSGRIVAANAAGRIWLGSQAALSRSLCRPGGPDPACFEVTASGSGSALTYLAVLRASQPGAAKPPPPQHWRLTPREHEVVALLARGASNQDIAATLDCSPRTVEHHVSSILRKAEVESRTALIAALLAR